MNLENSTTMIGGGNRNPTRQSTTMAAMLRHRIHAGLVMLVCLWPLITVSADTSTDDNTTYVDDTAVPPADSETSTVSESSPEGNDAALDSTASGENNKTVKPNMLVGQNTGSGINNTGAQHAVDPYYGSFGTEIPITVPAFRGLEPNLKLVYNSSGGKSGFAGVGWKLVGPSMIERGRPLGGVPNYDSTDHYFLDGEELIPCTQLGGTHCPKWS